MTENRGPLLDLVSLLARVTTMTMADSKAGDAPADYVRRTFDATIEALREDKKLAKRLLDIDDDWPIGGTFRREFAALRPYDPENSIAKSTPGAALRTANFWGPGARAVYRQVGDWPDGARWTGPWKDITNDEESVSD